MQSFRLSARPALLVVRIMPHSKITEAEFKIIEAHCQILMDGADDALANIMALPKESKSHVTAGQILYWQHVKAALRWTISIAETRRIKRNV
ncbi:hypothetical protein LCGC14_0893290 [marine sediment metagenome]|uniref:Uncharacterized protein n=1 Tax=marine sediment metagenome TaxID=412755 RepID=A0A0F9RHU6_9ZZZZ